MHGITTTTGNIDITIVDQDTGTLLELHLHRHEEEEEARDEEGPTQSCEPNNGQKSVLLFAVWILVIIISDCSSFSHVD